jgi:phosphoglycolate phosphatase
MSRAFDAIAFDLDGTLIDTAPDISAALNTALAAAGLATVAQADARSWIGDGPQRLVRRALDHLGVGAHDTLVARLLEGFEAATLAAPMALGRVCAGIRSGLERWQRHLPLVVVTNKPGALSRRVLQAAGIAQHFGAVFGGDEASHRKPAPGLLLAAAAHCGVAPARLLLVGDSANDARAAAAAGCPYVWVEWGYGVLPDAAGGAIARIGQADQLDALVAPQCAPA